MKCLVYLWFLGWCLQLVIKMVIVSFIFGFFCACFAMADFQLESIHWPLVPLYAAGVFVIGNIYIIFSKKLSYVDVDMALSFKSY